MYRLASLKPAAATKKVSCRTTSQAASSFRQPWWEIKPQFQCLADSASFRQTMLRWGHETQREDGAWGEGGTEREEAGGESLPLFSTPHTTSTLPCWASAIWFLRWGLGVSPLPTPPQMQHFPFSSVQESRVVGCINKENEKNSLASEVQQLEVSCTHSSWPSSYKRQNPN